MSLNTWIDIKGNINFFQCSLAAGALENDEGLSHIKEGVSYLIQLEIYNKTALFDLVKKYNLLDVCKIVKWLNHIFF